MNTCDLEETVKRKYSDPAEVAEYASLAGQGVTNFEAALIERSFSPGQLVLDIGCGGGREAVPMAQRGIQVVAMDLVPAMVRAARDRAVAQGVKLWPVVASATALPFRDRSFDGVALLGQVIAHVPSRAQRMAALAGVRHVLRPGGRVAMTTHNWRCQLKFRLYFCLVNRWRRFVRWCGFSGVLSDNDRWTSRISRAGSPAKVFFHMYDFEEALTDLRQAGLQVAEGKSRAEFESGRENLAERDRDYLLGFLATRSS